MSIKFGDLRETDCSSMVKVDVAEAKISWLLVPNIHSKPHIYFYIFQVTLSKWPKWKLSLREPMISVLCSSSWMGYRAKWDNWLTCTDCVWGICNISLLIWKMNMKLRAFTLKWSCSTSTWSNILCNRSDQSHTATSRKATGSVCIKHI